MIRLTHRHAEHTMTIAFSGTACGARHLPHCNEISTTSMVGGAGNRVTLDGRVWVAFLNRQQFISIQK